MGTRARGRPWTRPDAVRERGPRRSAAASAAAAGELDRRRGDRPGPADQRRRSSCVGLLLAMVLFGFWLRGRRRRPRAVAAVDPYATLAATPDPLGPTEPVDTVGSIEPVGSAEPVEPVDAGSGSGGEGPD